MTVSAIPGLLVDYDEASRSVETLLRYLGYDVTAPGLMDTPDRVVRALTEMTAGQWLDPQELLSRTFPADTDDGHDQLIAVNGVRFTAVCEHHLMPFSGTATVAYIPKPGAPVVGLSKLARLVELYARRLTMQERMTKQITDALNEHLSTVGSACIVRSHHACMGVRGVRQPDASMVTSSMTGLFRTDVRAREELMALASGG